MKIVEKNLTSTDGHKFKSYIAHPEGELKGAVVVLQEIFGINAHTLHDVKFFAQSGYLAIAPALFDRSRNNVILDYSDTAQGLAIANSIEEPQLLLDIQAAVDEVSSVGRVSVVGFCWGGALAYLAASQCQGVDSAACYYGSRIAKFCERMQPKVPVIYHFAELDKSLPPEAIQKIRAVDSTGSFYEYPGVDHAFTNNDRSSYNDKAAELAHARTLDFLSSCNGYSAPND